MSPSSDDADEGRKSYSFKDTKSCWQVREDEIVARKEAIKCDEELRRFRLLESEAEQATVKMLCSETEKYELELRLKQEEDDALFAAALAMGPDMTTDTAGDFSLDAGICHSSVSDGGCTVEVEAGDTFDEDQDMARRMNQEEMDAALARKLEQEEMRLAALERGSACTVPLRNDNISPDVFGQHPIRTPASATKPINASAASGNRRESKSSVNSRGGSSMSGTQEKQKGGLGGVFSKFLGSGNKKNAQST